VQTAEILVEGDAVDRQLAGSKAQNEIRYFTVSLVVTVNERRFEYVASVSM
jgi:hypothetical protein